MAPPRRKPSPAFARVRAAAASRARRQHTRRSGSASTSPESGRAQPTAQSCHSNSGPLLQHRKHSEQGGCGDAACGSWPARDVRSHQPATKSRVTCKRGLRGCSLWKLACERFSIQQHQRSRVAKPPAKGGSAGKQLVEAGLRAIGISVQQILCVLHFSQASASAALSTAMRAACDRLRARTARRARRRTRCTCAHEPRYNFNFKLNI